jgi:hypothetical protein
MKKSRHLPVGSSQWQFASKQWAVGSMLCAMPPIAIGARCAKQTTNIKPKEID